MFQERRGREGGGGDVGRLESIFRPVAAAGPSIHRGDSLSSCSPVPLTCRICSTEVRTKEVKCSIPEIRGSNIRRITGYLSFHISSFRPFALFLLEL